MASIGHDGQPRSLHETLNELTNLGCKLETKSKSLTILNQEIQQIKRERDEYKLMASQLQERCDQLKIRLESVSIGNKSPSADTLLGENGAFIKILCQFREHNRLLLSELEDVKSKLIDSECDVRLMRGQIGDLRKRTSENFDSNCQCQVKIIEPLMKELELMKKRSTLLEKDLESLLDEKEELRLSEQSYKAKVDRLLVKISSLMDHRKNDNDHWLMDVDSLIAENEFLTKNIAQFEQENLNLKLTVMKYRNIVERLGTQRPPGPHQLPTNLTEASSMVKDINDFLAANNLNTLELNQDTLVHLKTLVIKLYEMLNDKSCALQAHKKNNKLLQERMRELEDGIDNFGRENGNYSSLDSDFKPKFDGDFKRKNDETSRPRDTKRVDIEEVRRDFQARIEELRKMNDIDEKKGRDTFSIDNLTGELCGSSDEKSTAGRSTLSSEIGGLSDIRRLSGGGTSGLRSVLSGLGGGFTTNHSQNLDEDEEKLSTIGSETTLDASSNGGDDEADKDSDQSSVVGVNVGR